MSRYLNLEKLEYNDNIVEIDDLISDTILELNKKGYKTASCCSGHSKIELYQYILPSNEKNKIIENHDIIVEENDSEILACFPSISTYCYIKFLNEYNFKNIPEGFSLEDGNYLSKKINFFDENNKRKTKEEIENEIKKCNDILFDWVKKLEGSKNE